MSVIICAHTQNFSHRRIGMATLVVTGWRHGIKGSDYNKLSERQGVDHHFVYSLKIIKFYLVYLVVPWRKVK